MVEDNLLLLFPTPVVVSKYDKPYIDELIFIKSLDLDKSHPSNVEQSLDTFILNSPKLSKIKNFIESKINSYVENVMSCESELCITQSWVNKVPTMKSHHSHCHPNSIISGVWYPTADKNHPPLMFTDNDHRDIVLQSKKSTELNSKSFMFTPTPGDLIIFPSNLLHRVPVNNVQTDRISLSFNTWVKGNSFGSISDFTFAG